MELYHWVPGLRFYLLVKHSYDITDVDAVFKVNSLSSFTLGIYQLLGIMATVMEEKPMNIYVTMNVCSQGLNWGITILYFATSVSKWMGNAANVRSMSRHYQGICNAWAALQQTTASQTMRNPEEMRKARQQVDDFKKNVGSQVLEMFFPPAGPTQDSRGNAEQILASMGDQHVRDFVLILRNQAIASIDMPGGL